VQLEILFCGVALRHPHGARTSGSRRFIPSSRPRDCRRVTARRRQAKKFKRGDVMPAFPESCSSDGVTAGGMSVLRQSRQGRPPRLNFFALSPTAVTLPTISCPGRRINRLLPLVCAPCGCRSWQTPQKRISSCTSFGLSARRSIWKGSERSCLGPGRVSLVNDISTMGGVDREEFWSAEGYARRHTSAIRGQAVSGLY